LQELRNKERKEEETYVHHRIIAAEKKKPFKVSYDLSLIIFKRNQSKLNMKEEHLTPF